MDVDEVWFHVHTERDGLAQLLESLEPHDWNRPSLCAGWAVRHVAAHVISSPEARVGDVLGALWRGRGNFNRAVYLEGIRLGRSSPEQILASFYRNQGSRRHPPGTTHWAPLLDVLVHTQDIVVPIGLSHAMPIAAARAVAERVWSFPFPFYARRRLDRFRLTADDVDWSVGNGPEIHGPIAALLLLMTGREASVPDLAGDGMQILSHR